MVRVRQKQSENEKAGTAETNSPPSSSSDNVSGHEKKNYLKSVPDRDDLDEDDRADLDGPVRADGDDDDWTPSSSKKLQLAGSLVGKRKSTRARKPLQSSVLSEYFCEPQKKERKRQQRKLTPESQPSSEGAQTASPPLVSKETAPTHSAPVSAQQISKNPTARVQPSPTTKETPIGSRIMRCTPRSPAALTAKRPTPPFSTPREPTLPFSTPREPTPPVSIPKEPTSTVSNPKEPTPPVSTPKEPITRPNAPVSSPKEPTPSVSAAVESTKKPAPSVSTTNGPAVLPSTTKEQAQLPSTLPKKNGQKRKISDSVVFGCDDGEGKENKGDGEGKKIEGDGEGKKIEADGEGKENEGDGKGKENEGDAAMKRRGSANVLPPDGNGSVGSPDVLVLDPPSSSNRVEADEGDDDVGDDDETDNDDDDDDYLPNVPLKKKKKDDVDGVELPDVIPSPEKNDVSSSSASFFGRHSLVPPPAKKPTKAARAKKAPATSKTGQKPKLPVVPQTPETAALSRKLSALQKEDLVEIIKRAVYFGKVPTFSSLDAEMPRPNVKEFAKEVKKLKSAVMKAVPRSRWGSTRDHYCFLRCQPALNDFTRVAQEHISVLSKLEDWNGALEYALSAGCMFMELPTWDIGSDNYHEPRVTGQLKVLLRQAVPKLSFTPSRAEALLQEINDKGATHYLEVVVDILRKLI